MRRWSLSLLGILLALPLAAAPHEARVPLHDGKIRLADLSEKLLTEMHCGRDWVSLPGTIDVRGLDGARCVTALNQALGDGCRISVENDSLLLHVDCAKMPADWDSTKIAVRIFTACAAPEYTAAQQRHYGLKLPEQIDEQKRLVILIHGLACNSDVWTGLAPLLEREGYQVATFGYPAAQGIAQSAAMLAKKMTALHAQHPNLTIDVVTHSMGGLVARAYIEGSEYQGGVEHLVELTPPNHGSNWAKAEFAAKAVEHYELWKHDPDWHWTWMLTDGIGEAARDLAPGSAFLKQLNDAPRREGVKYTIIAGDQHPAWRITANLVGAPATWVPTRAANWWGFRQCRHGLENASASLRDRHSDSDGPVSLTSAKLPGVDDFVVVHAEHAALLCRVAGKNPAAWNAIRERLAH